MGSRRGKGGGMKVDGGSSKNKFKSEASNDILSFNADGEGNVK
jgi:hypothetical protein